MQESASGIGRREGHVGYFLPARRSRQEARGNKRQTACSSALAAATAAALLVAAPAVPASPAGAALTPIVMAIVERGASVALALTSQTITFGKLANKTFGAAPLTVSATASSGLPVSFASTTTPICTVGGNVVTIVAAGTCTIRASQAGNATYAAAPDVNRSFTVAKASQTITFPAPGNKTFDASPLTVAVTASSGLPVSFASTTTSVCTVSVTTVTFVKLGTCKVRASQSGNGNYNAASNVDRSFTISKGNQTINFGALGVKTIGAPPFAVSATASSGLAVTFSSLTTPVCTVSGSTATIVALGTCTIRAAQAGNANYNAAPNVDQSFAVAANNNVTVQYTYDAVGNLTRVQRVPAP